ncbi:hypothetical protein RJ641_011724, partial [Dillenia turbinata]
MTYSLLLTPVILRNFREDEKMDVSNLDKTAAMALHDYQDLHNGELLGTETFDAGSSELVPNLVPQLRNIDCDANRNLRLLLTVCGLEKKHFRISSRNQILRIGCEARSLIKVCNYAAEGLVRLHEGMKTVQTTDESQCHLIGDGLQLLLDVLKKWMCIPFQSPPISSKQGVEVTSPLMAYSECGPCILSELFACSTNKKKPELISVSPGHGEQSILGAGFQALEADEINDLSRKLFHFVTEGGRGIYPHYEGNFIDDQVVS